MRDKFIVCGMGGSALAAGLWNVAEPNLDLLIHRDYGLPRVPEYFLRESLIILSSYSGNTAEVLDTAAEALAAGLDLAVITSGGKLLDWAKTNDVPISLLPSGYEPRLALEPACVALASLLERERSRARPDIAVPPNEALAANLAGKILIIYSSSRNYPLAYHWKISLNETAKTPAFCNALPEQNHNELESNFDDKFAFIFLRDEDDDARISKRFEVLEKVYREQNLPVTIINLAGESVWEKIWQSVSLAEQAALALARQKGVANPEKTEVISGFKKLLE